MTIARISPDVAEKELQYRQAMKALISYDPNDKETEDLHKNPALVRAFLGGNGAGKTTWGALEAIWHAVGRHPYTKDHRNGRWLKVTGPPSRGRICCTDFQTGVFEQIVPALEKWLPNKWIRDIEYRQSSGAITSGAGKKYPARYLFGNGSEITIFTYKQQLDVSAGGEVDWVWCDEPPPMDLYAELLARLRSSRYGRLWITCTALETDWIHDEIVAKAAGNPKVFAYLYKDSTTNRHLDKHHLKSIFTAMPAHIAAMRKTGKTGSAGRLCLPMFDESVHVIPESLIADVPMTYFMAIDVHTREDFELRWVGVDAKLRHYVVREESVPVAKFHDIPSIAQEVEATLGVPQYRVIDTNAKFKEPTSQTTMVDQLAQMGFYTVFPDKRAGSRETGIQDIRTMLMPQAQFVHPRTEEPPAPELYVLASCETTKTDFERWSYAKKIKRERDLTDAEDERPRARHSHSASCVRYIRRVGTWYQEPERKIEPGGDVRPLNTEQFDPVTGAPA